ncbi:endonuclease/exonuclease/phosphatase family protein [Bacteroides sp.]|uniref:endonuclease/exonuclease/phosphatase family protein n=1 Tax=Bacteroides sp. TaxID=29523 RepID=UPI00258A1F51|nr:endonuclease/exonuclease/phosphatase family protein [Bacteroides sp.]
MKKYLLLLMAVSMGLLSACNSSQPKLDLKVMTFNIRLDTSDDGEYSWEHRKEQAGAMAKAQDCDLIGTQEVLHHQLEDLKAALPEYEAVGVGRADGKTEGEYSSLLYKKDRFDALDSGTFWLSETPEVAGSKGWDGACERVASWVLLKDKETLREVFFINTHLDHVGVEARREGVNLLLERAYKLAKDAPIVLTGDFNAEPESDVIFNVINPEKERHLLSTHEVAQEVKGTNWTFHDYDRLDINKREYIDYIFVSAPVTVKSYEVLPMKYEGQFVSDHCPVVANIEFN